MSEQTAARLRASYDRVVDARDVVQDELERFNGLVVDARREGMSWGQIAKATAAPPRKALSRARLMQIVGEHAAGVA